MFYFTEFGVLNEAHTLKHCFAPVGVVLQLGREHDIRKKEDFKMLRVLFSILASTLIMLGCATTLETSEFSASEKVYYDAVMACSTEFKLPKADAETAWARGVSFVNEYSGMRIDSNTEYSLSTYDPSTQDTPIYGYNISQIPEGESVTFKVVCLYNHALFIGLNPKEVSIVNAKLLSHYMKTGELNPKFIDSKVATK